MEKINQKPVLVTLADARYVKFAKQIFASAYFNAGWKGDFLLLAHHIPQEKLRWFKKKNISVWQCQNFLDNRESSEINIIHYSKMALLKKAIKNWDVVIFLDVDTIIRSSLDELLKVKTFAATPNYNVKFGWYFNRKIKKYDLHAKSFCSGIMAFNTRIINDKTYPTMVNLVKKYEKYKKLSKDEAFFNLFFYKKWIKLSKVYNIHSDNGSGLNPWRQNPGKLNGIIIHTNGRIKAWQENSPFYHEWLKNYQMADAIGIKARKNVPAWTRWAIFYNSIYLSSRFFIVNKIEIFSDSIQQIYYKILKWLMNKSPRIFYFLKDLKARAKGYKWQ